MRVAISTPADGTDGRSTGGSRVRAASGPGTLSRGRSPNGPRRHRWVRSSDHCVDPVKRMVDAPHEYTANRSKSGLDKTLLPIVLAAALAGCARLGTDGRSSGVPDPSALFRDVCGRIE